MKEHKKPIVWVIFVLAAILSIVFVQISRVQKEKALIGWLEQDEYSGILCFMHELSGFTEDNFLTYIGKKVIQREEPIKRLKDISRCMDEAFLKQPELSAVYLGLDPELIWKEASYDQGKWQENLEGYLMRIIDSHPETTFDIILPHPQLDYWTNKEEDKVDEAFRVYCNFVEIAEGRSNLRISFVGDQEWVICNRDNYTKPFVINGDVGKNIFLLTFCDGKYYIDSSSLKEKQKIFKELIRKETDSPKEYPDLSLYTVVFLGDSIFGIDRATTSIPSVVKSLSGAKVYNLGEGGLTATYLEEKVSFLTLVSALETKELTEEIKSLGVAEDLLKFLNRPKEKEALVFVINFGLNDYFQGQKVINEQKMSDTNTYAGGVKEGIERLKKAYPSCEIIVMGPTYTELFSEGTESMSEVGGRLTDYVEAAEAVAVKCGVNFKNNYVDLGVNRSNAKAYMDDGCHLNPNGRLIYGRQLVEFIDKEINR